MGQPIPENVRALESVLARLRRLLSELLSADSFDRWGPKSGPEYEQFLADDATARNAYDAATTELTSLVARMRREDPDAVARWADAHDRLLRVFIDAYAGAAENTTESTGIFVAEEERREWAAVKRGDRSFVAGNVYYVHFDPEQYRALFGIDP